MKDNEGWTEEVIDIKKGNLKVPFSNLKDFLLVY
tara:strand:- start:3335 stop:3436 length:102 start_codon:yes stop_codon:yes gene_type:complete